MTDLVLPTSALEAPDALAEIIPSDQNPAAVYLAGLGSAKSRRTMHGALKRIMRAIGSTLDPLAFPWRSIRYQHAVAIKAALIAQHGPATVNHALSALRSVMHESFRLGLISGEDWARTKDVSGIKYERLPTGRAIAKEELEALFAVCDRSDPIGIRDAALLAVLRVAGLRRAEACSLNLDSLDLATGEIRFIGKRNKERLGYLGDAVTDVAAWLEVRGTEPGPLFLSFEAPAGGRAVDGPRRLTEGAVYYILARLAARAMVRAPSPHDLRRTFITDLLDAKVDIVTVQKMAGHESVTTTARYDRRDEGPKRAAAALLKIPR